MFNFEPIEDKTCIWKYMNFEDFLYLLAFEQLFFLSVQYLEDQYEGELPISKRKYIEENMDIPRGRDFTITEIKEIMSKHFGLSPTVINKLSKPLDHLEKNIYYRKLTLACFEYQRRVAYVNCWCMEGDENFALWKIYGEKGIAVKTNIGKLKKAISDRSVQFYKVKYINRISEEIYPYSPKEFFIYKHKAYKYENEYRAIIHKREEQNLDGIKKYTNNEEAINYYYENIFPCFSKKGEDVPVDITELIDVIYVSPFLPQYVFDVVKNVVGKYLPKLDTKENLIKSELKIS